MIDDATLMAALDTGFGYLWTTPDVSVVVKEKPQPQPRPRARATKEGKAFVYDPGTAKEWRKVVADTVRIDLGDRQPTDGPVYVHVEFVFDRPKSHYTTGRVPHLKKDAPWYPSKNDVDNLLKSTLDALNGVLFVDDDQVVRCTVSKRYIHEDAKEGAHARFKAWWSPGTIDGVVKKKNA